MARNTYGKSNNNFILAMIVTFPITVIYIHIGYRYRLPVKLRTPT